MPRLCGAPRELSMHGRIIEFCEMCRKFKIWQSYELLGVPGCYLDQFRIISSVSANSEFFIFLNSPFFHGSGVDLIDLALILENLMIWIGFW